MSTTDDALELELATADLLVKTKRRVDAQGREIAALADPVTEQHRRMSEAVGLEQSALRRRSPARSRWPELVAIDERVLELDQRQAALGQQVIELQQQLQAAEEADRQALALWLGGGEKGPRPEPTAPAVQAALEARMADRDSADPARERLLAEKVALVERHRKRLVRDAQRVTEEAKRRYLELVDELAESREDLFASRLTALWASLYPSPVLQSQPPAQVVGGVLKLQQQALPGYTSQLDAERIWNLLRLDADYLAEAQTQAQHAELVGLNPQHRAPDKSAVWAQTEEGKEFERAERQAARERYRELWGSYPA